MSGICGVSGQHSGAPGAGISRARAGNTLRKPRKVRKVQVRGQKSLRGLRVRTTR